MAFDVITPAKLGRGAIGATVSIFYTVPSATRTFVKNIDIANTNSTALSVTVYLVPAAGAAGTSNVLIPNITLKGNMPFQWNGVQILNAGDTIQAVASTTGATINISGAEAV